MSSIRPLGLFVFSCLVGCLATSLQPWLILLCLLGIGWKFWKGFIRSAPLLIGMTIAAWGMLAFDSPRIWHRDTMAGAFIVATLYTMLAPSEKHRVMRFHAGLFSLLVMILVVPSETYPVWVYLGLTNLLCASLVFHHIPLESRVSLLALARTLAKLAIPVILILLPIYYFFPSLQSPMQHQGVTGMAGLLRPGEIAKLALSDRLAFRVKFIGGRPEPETLYWRADVLDRSHGMNWSRGTNEEDLSAMPKAESEPLLYELSLDSQLSGIIPVLENTIGASDPNETEPLRWQLSQRVLRGEGLFIRGGAKVSNRVAAARPKGISFVPMESSDRVSDLIASLRGMPAEEQIKTLLSRFRSFHYTLSPGRLTSDDPLDEFLFVTQKGYCEHFAAAFATLLQHAGTPVRVVVGYQGAQRLGASDLYQVTGENAHAWTEVWHQGAWQRVDPSLVAIDGGVRKDHGRNWIGLILAWLNFTGQDFMEAIKNSFEGLSSVWIVAGIISGGIVLIQIVRIDRRRNSGVAWERNLKSLMKKLERSGFAADAGETRFHYFHRLSGETGVTEFGEIARLYNLCKFAEDQTTIKKLQREIKGISPRISRIKRKVS